MPAPASIWFCALLFAVWTPTAVGADGPSFDKDVKPIFQARCLGCHGASAMGKLDLRNPDAILKGGASGPVVMPGASTTSLLIDKVVTQQMPPGKTKLTAAEIDQIRVWIDKSLTPAAVEAAAVTENEVRAILQARCVVCHGSGERSGGLDLRTAASRLKGGKSGPALVPGKPEESLLYRKIVDGKMPPAAEAKLLAVELPTAGETEKIRAWIATGAPGPAAVPAGLAVTAKDREFWSFQPPSRPTVPTVKDNSKVRNPIDAFVLAKLEAKGLTYSPRANRLTLLRRVYLDLTGIPPTPAQIDDYLKDQSPDAYERTVEQLLASPHYGERWGQHWLDMAGYSDSEGFGQDDGVRRYAWRYRDYVIRALNADKPYDRFLQEQIAGDELSDDWKKAKSGATQELIDRMAATGFLRTVPDPTDSFERGLIAERMNIVAEEVEVLSSSVMGLTVGCARCHNHKYDPIPQRDYYRLSAILETAYDPYEWRSPNKRELDLALDAERKVVEEANKPLQAQIKKLEADLSKVIAPFREKTPGLKDEELEKKFPELELQAQSLHKQLDEVKEKVKPAPNVRVLTDNAEPSQFYLLRRGDPVGFGEPVDSGVPLLFQNAALKPYQPVAPFAGTSGRRLALAQWLTQPNHPLTARVAVNQLWMRHFGRGIVPTVANFGRSGMPPTHPELLDWLATEFVERGWSLKSMHRLMVTSEAYRQSSNVSEALTAADPDNALLARMSLRRMDAETLFDSMLTASGRLDPTLFGTPTEVDVRPDKEVTVNATAAGFRRSIYVLHRRQTPMSLLDAFDQPAMTPNCTERRRSNVATQALHMMNGSMAWDLAKFMAGRVIDEAEGDRAKQIELVYLRAYARRPSEDEVRTGLQAITDFRKQWPARLNTDNAEAPRTWQGEWLALANYCHAILNSAEFSFVD
ncbi:MAG: DUF1553 domain-containing protein [Bryobacteraceae bacterium]